MSPLLDLMGRGRPGDGPRQKTVPKPYPGLELAPRRYNSMVVILLMLPLVLVLAELGCALHFSRISWRCFSLSLHWPEWRSVEAKGRGATAFIGGKPRFATLRF